MIKIEDLYHIQKILRTNLSNSIKDRDEMTIKYKKFNEEIIIDPFNRLCNILSDLSLLIKEVEYGSRIKKSNKMS